MPILSTAVDPRAPSYLDNRGAMLERLSELNEALSQARAGGGEKYVTRHHARGRLLPRERIELLVDRDTPFLELCAVAGFATDYPVGGSHRRRHRRRRGRRVHDHRQRPDGTRRFGQPVHAEEEPSARARSRPTTAYR